MSDQWLFLCYNHFWLALGLSFPHLPSHSHWEQQTWIIVDKCLTNGYSSVITTFGWLLGLSFPHLPSHSHWKRQKWIKVDKRLTNGYFSFMTTFGWLPRLWCHQICSYTKPRCVAPPPPPSMSAVTEGVMVLTSWYAPSGETSAICIRIGSPVPSFCLDWTLDWVQPSHSP